MAHHLLAVQCSLALQALLKSQQGMAGSRSSLSGCLLVRCGTCWLSDRRPAPSAGLWLAGGVQHLPGVRQLQDGHPQRLVGLCAGGGPSTGLLCARRST